MFNHFDFCADYQLEKGTKRKLRRVSGPVDVVVEEEDDDVDFLPSKRVRKPASHMAVAEYVDLSEMHTCLGCSESMPLNEMKAHLKKRHGGAKNNYKNYLARIKPIPGIIELQCQTCRLYYSNDSGMMTHKCAEMMEMRSRYENNYRFYSPKFDELAKTTEKSNDASKSVRIAVASVESMSTFDEHVCPICHKRGASHAMAQHIQSHTELAAFICRAAPMVNVIEMKCDKCRCYYRDDSELMGHNCDEMIAWRSKLNKNRYDLNEETYVCRACSRLFNREHMKKHNHFGEFAAIARSGSIPGLYDTECGTCHGYFRNETGVRMHNCREMIKWRHSWSMLEESTNETAVAISEAIHTCLACKKQFNAASMKVHLYNTHKGIKKYISRSALIPGVIDVRCEVCGTYYNIKHNCDEMKMYRDQMIQEMNEPSARLFHRGELPIQPSSSTSQSDLVVEQPQNIAVTPNKSVVAITQNGQPVQYFMIGTPVDLSALSLTTSEQREADSDGVTVEKIDDDGGSEPTLAIECKEEAKSEDEMVNVAMNEVFGFVSAESVEEGFKDNQQLDLELHKWAADDKMVECFMIDCNHQDSFSKIIAHLRKG